MHSRSRSVKLIDSVVKNPLLRMLRWLRVAPLGRPVVPEVYWMLIGSSGRSVASTSATVDAGTDSPSATNPAQSSVSR